MGRERDSLVAQSVKNPSVMQETWVQSLGWEDPLGEGMETHSSILAWRIPMDRGAWRAAIRGVTKGRTQLSDWSGHSTGERTIGHQTLERLYKGSRQQREDSVMSTARAVTESAWTRHRLEKTKFSGEHQGAGYTLTWWSGIWKAFLLTSREELSVHWPHWMCEAE